MKIIIYPQNSEIWIIYFQKLGNLDFRIFGRHNITSELGIEVSFDVTNKYVENRNRKCIRTSQINTSKTGNESAFVHHENTVQTKG